MGGPDVAEAGGRCISRRSHDVERRSPVALFALTGAWLSRSSFEGPTHDGPNPEQPG